MIQDLFAETIVQNLYSLSDMATRDEAIDSRAFSAFCGTDRTGQVPDGDTIGRFRRLLEKHGIQEKLFAQVREFLIEKGLLLKFVPPPRCSRAL